MSHDSSNEMLPGKVYVENSPKFVAVVAAAIGDAEGRILLQQCLPHKRHAGRWEFPGGKVENKEIPRLALCREVFEELGLELDAGALAPAGFAEEAPAEGRPGLVLLLTLAVPGAGRRRAGRARAWAGSRARKPRRSIFRRWIGPCSPAFRVSHLPTPIHLPMSRPSKRP